MTKSKNKKTNYTKSGLLIIITIVLIGGIFFTLRGNFIGNKTNGSNTTSYSCGQNTNNKNSSTCSMGLPKQQPEEEYAEDPYPEEDNFGIIQEPVDQKTTKDLLNYEVINVGHDRFTMVPEITTLEAGKNYKLVITPSRDGGGCMSTLTIPGIDENIYRIKKDIPITITIDNAKSGKYEVICGSMGMYQGQIIIK